MPFSDSFMRLPCGMVSPELAIFDRLALVEFIPVVELPE